MFPSYYRRQITMTHLHDSKTLKARKNRRLQRSSELLMSQPQVPTTYVHKEQQNQLHVKSSKGSYQRGMSLLSKPSQYTYHMWASSAAWRPMACDNTCHSQTTQSSHFLPTVESVIGNLGPRIRRCPAMVKADTRIPSLSERFVIAFNKSSLIHVWQHSCFRQTCSHDIWC